MYFKLGCYKVRLVIWNFVSWVELFVLVKIIEIIINVELKVVNFEYFVYFGIVGGGLIGNIFFFEYLVFFIVLIDIGICFSYDWCFGDVV